ncbi:hypothetical protein ACQKII_20745 [Lysinibacillus sp. NPDC048646]
MKFFAHFSKKSLDCRKILFNLEELPSKADGKVVDESFYALL